jgi:hypothetical protein
LRVLSFGDLSGQVWGAAIDAPDPAIVLRTPEGAVSAAGPGAITFGDDGDSWRVRGEGVELLCTPTPIVAAAGELGAFAEELCELTGSVRVAGADHALSCVGIRGSSDGVDPDRLDSVRGLSGWFEPGRAVGLLAFRPAGRSDHGHDRLSATLFEPDGTVAVADPRLSTTYVSDGRPGRASLELWIGEGDEQYPRRAAAEASGDPVEIDGGRVRLQVTPLRCHTAGLDGSGVYILARF